jgi:hypothetical protein
MLRMFRLRGKRIWFLLFAACATFLIFRWGRETEQSLDYDLPIPQKQEQYEKPITEQQAHKEIENIVKEIVSKTSSTSEVVVETSVAAAEESMCIAIYMLHFTRLQFTDRASSQRLLLPRPPRQCPRYQQLFSQTGNHQAISMAYPTIKSLSILQIPRVG